MNRFQENILNQLPQFNEDDFNYFLEESQAKVQSLDLDPACQINISFEDSIDPQYNRSQYCLKNCGFKCLGITEGKHKQRLLVD